MFHILKCGQDQMSSFHKQNLYLGCIRANLGRFSGQIADPACVCRPCRERFKRTPQQIPAVQSLHSAHPAKQGMFCTGNEYTKTRAVWDPWMWNTAQAMPQRCSGSAIWAVAQIMRITRQDKSFPFTLILWCHPYYKLPFSFSYLKTPKQACHALLLLALQSHHSDRY